MKTNMCDSSCDAGESLMGFNLLSVFQSCSVWSIRGQQMERGGAAAAAGAWQSESSLL